jgi:hypothetical protein
MLSRGAALGEGLGESGYSREAGYVVSVKPLLLSRRNLSPRAVLDFVIERRSRRDSGLLVFVNNASDALQICLDFTAGCPSCPTPTCCPVSLALITTFRRREGRGSGHAICTTTSVPSYSGRTWTKSSVHSFRHRKFGIDSRF